MTTKAQELLNLAVEANADLRVAVDALARAERALVTITEELRIQSPTLKPIRKAITDATIAREQLRDFTKRIPL